MSPIRIAKFGKPEEHPKRTRPVALRNAMAGARLITEAVTEDSQPSTWRGRQRERKTKFDQALSLIRNSLPKEARVEILRQVQESVREIIQAEELSSITPVTIRNDANELAIDTDVAVQADRQNHAFITRLQREADEGMQDDIRTGRLLSSSEMIGRLKLSKQALSAAVKNQRMFALSGPSGENYYPAFFADSAYDRRILELVSKKLGTLSSGSKWQFFTMPKASLTGQTPLVALKKGKLTDVLAAAEAFMEE